ncbi:hypothetical protein [Rhodopirellula sp. P2]|uniref:hypothetical protein n=1 Tax=Rhodopirellula sp. P2 TaxID=2127060 RepID=UPI002368584B|nr:hypothetical protein [Rhodopirellula sp. P2]WDQ18901.1 hypothetical protein PSR62_10235 [Rhodopirellula sp. P2]
MKIELYCGYEDQETSCFVDEGGNCGGAEYHEGIDDGNFYHWISESWPLTGNRVQPEEIYEFTDLHYEELDCGDFNFCSYHWDENNNMICASDVSTVFNEKIIQNSTTACEEF